MAGVKACDEVITTAQTMMATSHVILAQQAKPVFADVQYDTGNIDPNDIERRITPRTKAISVVHWAGYPCDMDEVKQIAGRHGLAVIEDAAHALGASYRGKPIGTISDYTCFSFQAIKHVTTGDGGMLSVLTQAKYEEARRRRWYGLDRDKRVPSPLGEAIFNVTEVGYKAHMNDIAAAMGLEHLKEFDRIFARRHKIARHYREELANVPGLKLFRQDSDREHGYWLFPVHVENRLDFISALKGRSIEASVVHLRIDRNEIFGGLRTDLPHLDRFTETQVCIPLHAELTDADVDAVVAAIKRGW